MTEPGACDSCGAPDDELVTVRRVYLELDDHGRVASTTEVDEVEHWCVPCRSQYPNRHVDD